MYEMNASSWNCMQANVSACNLKLMELHASPLKCMQNTKTNNFNYTEEEFLLPTFSEFVKCWKSNKKSHLFIEVNSTAFVNFSVLLGNPSEAFSSFIPTEAATVPR